MKPLTEKEHTEPIDFGDYVEIEMYRYHAANEFFIHKVIGALVSNTFATVPIRYGETGTGTKGIPHKQSEEILNVVCCGIDESKVFRVRKADVRKVDLR